MRQKLFVSAFLFALTSAYSFAQNNEFATTFGVSVVNDAKREISCAPSVSNTSFCPLKFNTHTDAQFSLEANYARRLATFKPASLWIEFPAVFVPIHNVTETSPSSFPTSFGSSSFFFTPSIKLKFRSSAVVSPFASVGGGLVHFGHDSQENKGAFQFGGGVDIKTPLKFLSVRGQVRDFLSIRPAAEPRTDQHNVFVSGGLVFHF